MAAYVLTGQLQSGGADPRARAGEADQGTGGDALAGAGLPDDGHALAGLDGEADPTDRGHLPGRGVEVDVQVLDRDQGAISAAARRWACQCRPTTVSATTVAVTATPGRMLIHQATWR
ncbi:hypothetical protein GCM10027614_83030 [Micromonospora vulcania]